MTAPSELDLGPSSVKLKLCRLEDMSPSNFGNVKLPTSLKWIAEADANKKQRLALEHISQPIQYTDHFIALYYSRWI